MSNQEANKIRKKLVPFMTLLLAVACMGLLASCGGGSATTNNNGQVIPADGTTRRTVTTQDVVVGEVTEQKYVAGELLIYLRSANDQSQFVALLNAKNWVVIAYDEPLNLYTVQTYAKNESELISFKSELERLEYVNWTRFNNVLIGPKSKTSDPSWLEDAKSWNLNAINLSEARDLISSYTLDTSINVGIVDSKFTSKHEDLKFKSIERDAGDDPIGIIAGVRGGRASRDNPDHGMHVGGIIGSLQNNIGTVGISPEVLLNGADPYNTNGLSTNGAIGRSILNLKRTGSKVVNISLGNLICDIKTGQCTSQSEIFPFGQSLAVKEMVSELYGYIQFYGEGNVLFVQSSGNDGGNFLNKKIGEIGDASQRIYADHNGYVAAALSLKLENETSSLYGVPKNYGDMQRKIVEHSLIVGAYVSNNGVKAITSYTQIPSQNAELLNANFLLAPGGDSGRGIYSAVLPGLFNSGEYDYMNGTSMAAPHVSGVAALLLQINPLLKSWDIRKIILDNSDVVDGYRALNAEKSVKAAIETLPKPTATISIITPKPTAGTETIFRADVTSTPNGAVNQIEWDFGDGTVQMQTGSEMFHTYTLGGTYTVKLKIKDVKGVTNTTSTTVSVAGVSSSTSILYGALVTDSCLSCPVERYGNPNNITDGNYETARNLGTYSGSFNLFVNSPVNLSRIRLLPSMSPNGNVDYEILTTTDAIPTVDSTWVSHGRSTEAWANSVWFEKNLANVNPGARVVKIIVHRSPSWVALMEVEGFSSVNNAIGSFSVPANLEAGIPFVVPSNMTSCQFNASGAWKSNTTIIDAIGIPGATNPNFTWAMPSANSFSLIAKSPSIGHTSIGISASLSVTGGDAVYFLMNDALGYYGDNSGSISVSYACH